MAGSWPPSPNSSSPNARSDAKELVAGAIKDKKDLRANLAGRQVRRAQVSLDAFPVLRKNGETRKAGRSCPRWRELWRA